MLYSCSLWIISSGDLNKYLVVMESLSYHNHRTYLSMINIFITFKMSKSQIRIWQKLVKLLLKLPKWYENCSSLMTGHILYVLIGLVEMICIYTYIMIALVLQDGDYSSNNVQTLDCLCSWLPIILARIAIKTIRSLFLAGNYCAMHRTENIGGFFYKELNAILTGKNAINDQFSNILYFPTRWIIYRCVIYLYMQGGRRYDRTFCNSAILINTVFVCKKTSIWLLRR